MTNIERQKKLDKGKWFTSKLYDNDLSGKMWYCLNCSHSNCLQNCSVTQKEREENCLCAKAYNKAKRKK